MKKLRVWDDRLLAETYEITAQMQAQIEQLLSGSAMEGLSEMPHSLVPTKTLYEITLCYDLMYNLLVNSELVKSGHHTNKSNTIH